MYQGEAFEIGQAGGMEIEFVWHDSFSATAITAQKCLALEEASILFNIASMLTALAADQGRHDEVRNQSPRGSCDHPAPLLSSEQHVVAVLLVLAPLGGAQAFLQLLQAGGRDFLPHQLLPLGTAPQAHNL